MPCVLLGSVAAAVDNNPALSTGSGFEEWKKRRGKSLAGDALKADAGSTPGTPVSKLATAAAPGVGINTDANKGEKNKPDTASEVKKDENKESKPEVKQEKGGENITNGAGRGRGIVAPSASKAAPSKADSTPSKASATFKPPPVHPHRAKANEAFQKFIKDIPCFEGLKGSSLRALSIRDSAKLGKLVLVVSTYEPFTSKLMQLDKGKFVRCDADCMTAMKEVAEKTEVKKLKDPLATSITPDPNSTTSQGSGRFKDFVKDTPLKKFDDPDLRVISLRYSPALETLIVATGSTKSSKRQISWLTKENSFEECNKDPCAKVMSNQVEQFAKKRLSRRLTRIAEKAQQANKSPPTDKSQPENKTPSKVPELNAVKSK
jgi:hypothetical protein